MHKLQSVMLEIIEYHVERVGMCNEYINLLELFTYYLKFLDLMFYMVFVIAQVTRSNSNYVTH